MSSDPTFHIVAVQSKLLQKSCIFFLLSSLVKKEETPQILETRSCSCRLIMTVLTWRDVTSTIRFQYLEVRRKRHLGRLSTIQDAILLMLMKVYFLLIFATTCYSVFHCTTWAQAMLVAVLTHLMSLPIFQQLMAVSNKTALRGEAKPVWRGKSCWNMADAKKLGKFFFFFASISSVMHNLLSWTVLPCSTGSFDNSNDGHWTSKIFIAPFVMPLW